ncbi:MAG: T9SS type A sorting domain-containing protein [Dysgonamonadaceae bacterium]|jgi:hypothetical protein|nr:T9SS type A sorting domain-containing protein [Dysgonamonadaceae bacterium]
MKKQIFTALFLLSLVFGLQAQTTLATFEDGGENHLRVGDYSTDGDPGWYGDVYVSNPAVGDNPSKSGINTSDKCVVAVLKENSDWWGCFFVLMLDNPVSITESNKYLHLQVYRSVQVKNFCIGFNERNEDSGRVFSGKLSADGVWENVVVDLSSKIGQELNYISFITMANWDDPKPTVPQSIFAVDNIVLSNSQLPPGVTLVDGNGLFVGFEIETEINTWVHEIDLLNASNAASIIDNPFGAATLIGNKIVKFDKSADASWWQGYRIDFNGIMQVGGDYPNVLHILTYVPSAVFTAEAGLESIDIQLCAKDHLGNENTRRITVWDDETDKWIDLVMEINTINYLKEVTVRYDLRQNGDEYVNSPANTYYLDAIAFDKSSDEREVTVGISTPAINQFASLISEKGKLTVATGKNAKAEIFNLVGQRVETAQIGGTASIPLASGIYIVKITSAANELQIGKVIVK